MIILTKWQERWIKLIIWSIYQKLAKEEKMRRKVNNKYFKN